MLIGLQVRCYLGDNEQRWFMWYSGNNTAGRPIDAVTPSSGSTGDYRAKLVRVPYIRSASCMPKVACVSSRPSLTAQNSIAASFVVCASLQDARSDQKWPAPCIHYQAWQSTLFCSSAAASTCNRAINNDTCSCELCCSACTTYGVMAVDSGCMCNQEWPQAVMGWIGKGCPLHLRLPHQPLQLRTRPKRIRSWFRKERAVSWSQGRIGGPLTPTTWLFQTSR